MTGLAQSATDSDIPEVREVSKYAEPAQQSQPDRRRPRWFGAIGIWRGISWLSGGFAACLAIAAFSGYQNAVQIPALRARTASLETPAL